jgi:prepilin-type N-terminal cleavage/methylation domain-containing protein
MDGCSNARTQHGFTLIEVLIAVFLMALGMAVTIAVLGASDRRALGAQRSDVAVEKAQAEIDRLATLEYGEIAMTAPPPSSVDPQDPDSRATASTFKVSSALTEQLVLSPGGGLTAKVDSGPQSFAVGVRGAVVTGKVYRFVSWRDEQCPSSLCDGTQNTKRVTVAVKLDPSPTQIAGAPVWISTVVADRDTVPPGSTAAPVSGPTVTAQSFYLYDTSCAQTSPQPQSGSHPTHDTAAAGETAADDSTCENPAGARQPDLMGPSLPDADSTAPLYDYSSDLSGARPGGLALIHNGETCSTSYPAGASDPGAPSPWSVHAWNTNPFASTFHLSGQVTLSLFTTTIGGVGGLGLVCASLVDRGGSGGVPEDRTLGSFVYDLANWPDTPRRLTFTFNLADEEDLAAGHRLELVLQARGESDNDLVLLYDHPLYPSLLEVATSTPLTS